MRQPTQRAFACPCGNPRILAKGLCACCYTLKRQDEAYFGGLREEVLARDNYCCRVCGGGKARGKRSVVVHHRRPGVSKLRLMISLCPGCHARIHKTIIARNMPRLLLELWRELHPRGIEQGSLSFTAEAEAPEPLRLALEP